MSSQSPPPQSASTEGARQVATAGTTYEYEPSKSTGSFTISTDRARGMLIMEFGGFLLPTDLADYESKKAAAIVRLGRRPNDHVTLCDFSACGAQSQEVVGMFRASLENPVHMSRRLAVVVNGALVRLQASRILDRPGSACFECRLEAERWLVGPDNGQVT